MRVVEFTNGTLRILEQLPAQAPPRGFVWIYLERDTLQADLAGLQAAAQALGGSAILDLHVQDLANREHPSSYDYTSVYDVLVFRRLATEAEVRAQAQAVLPPSDSPLAAFARVRSRAVGFAVFDRLLISVHPPGCYTAETFMRRFLNDAVQSDGLVVARTRLPSSPADLMLRMLNVMVDSYLELRKQLSAELDTWQSELLASRPRGADWRAFMTARAALQSLQDLCEGQNDAMQEWLDAQQEQPPVAPSPAEREAILARARDVVEHIERVSRHVHRMEQGAQTAVQIHFSALSHRTNEIMRVLTALTAVFLPLNFITGFFGMNFEFLPLIHSTWGLWATLGTMATVLLVVLVVFWRRRYLAHVR